MQVSVSSVLQSNPTNATSKRNHAASISEVDAIPSVRARMMQAQLDAKRVVTSFLREYSRSGTSDTG